MTLVFTAIDVKNDISLCNLDANVKNRMAVTGSVSFFKLEWKLFKGKSVTYSKFYFENQMWKIKKYERESIYHECMVWIEKSVTWDHCLASHGKPQAL